MGLRASVPAAVLLAACSLFVCAPRALRADDEPQPTPVDALLGSPLRSEREEGVQRLVAAGPAGLEAARGLLDAPDGALRIGAWRALGLLGEWEDLDAALAGLDAADEAEADAAARAALQMAARLPLRATPPLRTGTLSRRGVRALLAPVADLLRRSTPDEVPPALLRLGGGLAPCLVTLARADDRGLRPREEAVDVLAALGGPEVRRDLVSLLELPWDQDLGRVLRALRHVARGPGLEPAEEFAQKVFERRLNRRWRVSNPMQDAALFLQACPPPVPSPALKTALLERIEREKRPSPRPGSVLETMRAFLACGPPTNVEFEKLTALLAPPSTERTWVVVALEPYKANPIVRRTLEELEDEDDLPPAFEGWVRLLLGRTDAARLLGLARAAIEANVTAAGPDARRLGLLLLTRLPGEPPERAVRLGLEDVDPWCRACALSLVERMPETGPIQGLAQVLTADGDPWVMEAAAELSCVAWDPPLRARLADALLAGPRDLRARIVALLARRAGLSYPPGLPESIATASIDVRMRLAARVLAEGAGK